MHLHFVQSVEPLQGGGLGGAAMGLHSASLQKGISSQLICTRSATFDKEWPGVIQAVRSGVDKCFYSRDLVGLAKDKVREAKFVHGHGLYTFCNWAFGAEARRMRRRMIYHVHGFFDPWILRRSKWKKRMACALFESRNMNAVGLWRALTTKERDQIRSYGIKAPVVIAPNGIDLVSMDRAREEGVDAEEVPRLREKRCLFLGRLHPKKGLDILVEAWAKLSAEFGEWELLIVGPDEGGYQESVEDCIERRGVADSCRIVGTLVGRAKAAVFGSSDLFVLGSYSEGFPIAVVEAAAHSLPVVMTNECNFPELAVAGAAWECAANVDSLYMALRTALSVDDAERKERGILGRKLIERSYTWPRIAEEIVSACESI